MKPPRLPTAPPPGGHSVPPVPSSAPLDASALRRVPGTGDARVLRVPHAGLPGCVLPFVLGRHAPAVPGVHAPRGALFLGLQRQQRRRRLRRVKGCCPSSCLIKCDARSCGWRLAGVGVGVSRKRRPARPSRSWVADPRPDRSEESRGRLETRRVHADPGSCRKEAALGGGGGASGGRGGAWGLRFADLVSDAAAAPRVVPHLLPSPGPELRGYAAGAALGPGTPGRGQPPALPAAPEYR